MAAADVLTTIVQLLRLADQNVAPEFASDLLKKCAFLRAMQAVTANASQGTQHKYLKHVTAPTVGFRAVNTGMDATSSDQALVTVDLKNLSAPVRLDKLIAEAYPQGAEACLDIQSMLALTAALQLAEKQLFYGDAAPGNAGGFKGFFQASTVQYKNSAKTLDATGATNGDNTDILLLKFGPGDVELILGKEGNIEIGETHQQLIPDANGKLFPAYCRETEGLLTVKVGAQDSIVRITNVGSGAGKTCTDNLLYAAMELFDEGEPDLIVMHKRSRGQLRKSRTATNEKGKPAPYPTDIDGIPIIVSGQLVANLDPTAASA